MAGTDNPARGQVVINPIASNPEVWPGTTNTSSRGAREVTMLSMWGVIVVRDTLIGFAMEFIGDAHDSQPINTHHFSGLN